MTIQVSTESAVVAVCGRCGKRSQPLDPQKVEEWTRAHEGEHEHQDLIARMAEAGHTITVIVDDMDMDWTDCHAECSCGSWRSPQCGAQSAAAKYGDAHLKTEDRKLQAEAA